MMPRVLHLLYQFSPGGAAQMAVRAVRLTAGRYTHEIVTLAPPVPGATLPAETESLRLTLTPSPEALRAALAAADLVHVHFWNTPELYAALQAEWPPARVLLWSHVAGHTTPHVLTPALLQWADGFAAAAPATLALPAVQAAQFPAGARLLAPVLAADRLAYAAPAPHAGFNVGYLGTLSFEKLHPDYVALHAGIRVPARFILGGVGGAWPHLRRQADRLGVADRFDYRGFVRDVGGLLSTLDVFGYPLAADTSATAELVLQEALYVGVPPVIFRHSAASALVVHHETGLVVADAPSYQRAIEHLYHHPAERARLSANAQAYARAHFRTEALQAALLAAYADVMRLPKRLRPWPPSAPSPWLAAAAFVASLGATGAAAPFALSLAAGDAPADEAAVLVAEARIAAVTEVVASAAAGGVLHYRRAYPEDALLRLWAGLVLGRQGRPALAVAEFTQAARLGLAHWRVDWYLAQAAVACRALDLARAALARVLAAAPGFSPAAALAAQLR